MNEPPRGATTSRSSGRLAGALAAFLVAAVAIALARMTDAIDAFNEVPFLQVLGGGVAVVLGAWIGPVVQRRSGGAAFLIALGYGALVPAVVAAILTVAVFPVLPIALLVSATAWAISMPAALAWLGLLRWAAAVRQLERPAGAVSIAVFATLLIVWRFTQPLVARSPDGVCLSLPGEQIVAIEWSRDGSWLGFATSRDSVQTTLWLLDPRTSEFRRVASGPGILGEFGFVVGEDGSITYQDDGSTPDQSAYVDWQFALWVASPGDESRRLGDLPGLMHLARGEGYLTGTIDVDNGDHRQAYWVRPSATGVEVAQLQPDELARNPEIGIDASLREPFLVEVDGHVHRVAWPSDVSYGLSITPNHRWLVFQSRLVDGQGEEAYNRLVAQDVATGARVVIRDGQHWHAEIAGGRLAALAFPNVENRLCVSELDPGLGLGS